MTQRRVLATVSAAAIVAALPFGATASASASGAATALSAGTAAAAGAATGAPKDVSPSRPFYDDIMWAIDQGVIPLWNANQFKPTFSVSREDMARFAYAWAGSPAVSVDGAPYKDIRGGSQSVAAITWAKEAGIITGWADGTFRPRETVRRDQAAAILYRLAGSPDFTAPATSPFADLTPSSPFYKEITWAASQGLIRGWTIQAPDKKGKGKVSITIFGPWLPVTRDQMAAFLHRLASSNTPLQVLSFNDYHGHLEANDAPLDKVADPAQTPVGGVEYLKTNLDLLRAKAGKAGNSITVTAGDLVGGSPFLSGMFHDEPSVESLNALGLDTSSVGNHEFDEGTTELLRMQNGGCHPKDGCYFPTSPFAGASYQYLAANVVNKSDGKPILPATWVKKIDGVKVGVIGMTLKATPTLVDPAGVGTVDFLDEVTTANAQAAALRKQGVEAIIVAVHEGGYNAGTYDGCDGVSEPIMSITKALDPSIDMVISGHTHQAYVCHTTDPAGNDRLLTSAYSYGRAITDTELSLNRRTKDVVRSSMVSNNVLNARSVAKDPTETAILTKWKALSDAKAAEVVGTNVEPITGDAGGNRGIETPMTDLIADAILWGTKAPENGGAQIAFMNVGGVRASFQFDPKYAEGPGQITYAEAYDTSPFGNMLQTIDLTGAQIKTVLEQQYQPVAARGSRAMLALGVSKGFSYTWDATAPQGSRVVEGSMKLNGVVLDPAATYRVATLNFLINGGDLFTGFCPVPLVAGACPAGAGNLKGGNEDLANLVAYLRANPGLTAPEDRIAGL